jgi:hypothetical protein
MNRENAAYQEAQEDKKQYKTAMGLVTTPMSTSALAQANQNITEGDYKGLGSPWNADLRKSAMNYIPAGEDAVKQEVANALGIQPAFVKAQTDYANSQTAIGNAKKLNMELKTAESEKRIRELSGQFWGTLKSGSNPAEVMKQAQDNGYSDIEIHDAQAAAARLAYADEETRGKLYESKARQAKAIADDVWKGKRAYEYFREKGDTEGMMGSLRQIVEKVPNYFFEKNKQGGVDLMFDDPFDNEPPKVHTADFKPENAAEFLNISKEQLATYIASNNLAMDEQNQNAPAVPFVDSDTGKKIKARQLSDTWSGKTRWQLYDYETGKSLGEPVPAPQFRNKYVVYDEKTELAKQKELAEIRRTEAQTGNYKAQEEYTRGAKTDYAGGKGIAVSTEMTRWINAAKALSGYEWEAMDEAGREQAAMALWQKNDPDGFQKVFADSSTSGAKPNKFLSYLGD